MAKPKKPKGTSRTGYGILNPYGDMWTSEVFDTPAQAQAHLEGFWKGIQDHDLSKFKIVHAKQACSFVSNIQ
jgi:hypothetical protein